jgi:hypothetical protein
MQVETASQNMIQQRRRLFHAASRSVMSLTDTIATSRACPCCIAASQVGFLVFRRRYASYQSREQKIYRGQGLRLWTRPLAGGIPLTRGIIH